MGVPWVFRGGLGLVLVWGAVGPGPLVGGSGPTVWCVLGGVLLSRTLAGAVPSALSGLASGFGMGAGRFPVAVTTETIVRAVRESLDTDLVVLCVAAPPVCGWVGCGPYSGRSRLFLPPQPVVPLTRWWWGLLFVLAY